MMTLAWLWVVGQCEYFAGLVRVIGRWLLGG